MLLALDPGETKVGWALVELSGQPRQQGIWPAAHWEERLGEQSWTGSIELVVIGDGTARMNIEPKLARLLPQASLAVVNEKESTVEAWQLKRSELAGRNPLRGIFLFISQLFFAPPVDDYAARVLARRYLQRQSGE